MQAGGNPFETESVRTRVLICLCRLWMWGVGGHTNVRLQPGESSLLCEGEGQVQFIIFELER